MVGVDDGSVPLVAGEQLLWSGRPTQAPLVFTGRDWLHVPLGLLFAAVVLTVTVRGLIAGLSGPVVSMAPLIVVAAYLSVGRLALNWYLRRRTRYFLTTDRVIASRSVLGRTRVVERAMADVVLVEKRVAADGSGTVRFDPEPLRLGLFARRRLSDLHDTGLHGLQFYRIDDAALVIELLETPPRTERR